MVDLDAFRRYTEWHDHANGRRYEAPADPWRLVPVDPAGVNRFRVVDLRYGLGQVRGGDWDRPDECRSLTENRLYEGLTQRFEEGRPWEETAYHDYVREQFESESGFRGLQDYEEHGPKWFAAVEDLYESIAASYRTNRGETYERVADIEYVHEMEPLALLGRDGDVIWTEGFHRLVLSRLAGVDRVPVWVLWRHEEWQAVRDAVAGTGTVPDGVAVTADHPDLADVVGDG